MTIKFQDPPSGRRADWHSIAGELRDNPGQWALVKEGAGNAQSAYAIRRGIIAAFRPVSHWEARGVSVGDGRFDIYARYVGGEPC